MLNRGEVPSVEEIRSARLVSGLRSDCLRTDVWDATGGTVFKREKTVCWRVALLLAAQEDVVVTACHRSAFIVTTSGQYQVPCDLTCNIPVDRRGVPELTTTNVYRRDLGLCAYCGKMVQQGREARGKMEQATRDHLVPVGQGGPDIWTNVVCSCAHDNGGKGCRSPKEAGVSLLFRPYKPTVPDLLMTSIYDLQRRGLLADDVELPHAGHAKNRIKDIQRMPQLAG